MGYLVDELDLFGYIFVLHADSTKDEAKSSSQLCQTSIVFAIGFDGSLLMLQCQFVPFQALFEHLVFKLFCSLLGQSQLLDPILMCILHQILVCNL